MRASVALTATLGAVMDMVRRVRMGSRAAPRESAAPSPSGLWLAGRRVALFGFFAVLPVLLFVWQVVVAIDNGYGKHFAFDFQPLWEAARHIAHGVSPYPAHTSAVHDEHQFVYPPLATLIAAPFAVFPFPVAATLYAGVMLCATALTLRLLGVRDWRCYGAALLWMPVVEAVRLGTVSTLLALLLALAWRYRDSRWTAPIIVAALVAVKVFLWPILFWLVATRRGFAAVRALALAVGALALSWATIGFAGLTTYPRLLEQLARAIERKGYSVVAAGLAFGLSPGEARAVAVACGALAVVAVFAVGRAGAADADLQAFVIALGASFLFSPVVWLHYLVLLLVPLAITRKRLTPLWLIPLALWATPGQSHGEGWRVALGLSVWIVVLLASTRSSWGKPALRRPAGAESTAVA